MFLKSLTALALASFSAARIILQVPTNPVVGAETDINWSSDSASDPQSFTLFLLDANNLPFGLSANFGEVETSTGGTTVTIPSTVHEGQYVLRAVNSTSVDFVFATSPQFDITT
ncbi:hypothetical protein K435DRAFT_972382 [Dendrothele bispora CBS 962.96]|uniref:Yeast cell wall synthesis Kre9/Knh1-like N-terminal domain-containing protein n=1 Tax=Dendrothele bispora (strain CBS 962.96) TaxID=1314807 RepID=A0A4S8KZB1_DENBC|nr:hypothetical protein K435DRAFT_972382 [Dendrothele bispora CBS 962.96]